MGQVGMVIEHYSSGTGTFRDGRPIARWDRKTELGTVSIFIGTTLRRWTWR